MEQDWHLTHVAQEHRGIKLGTWHAVSEEQKPLI